MGRTYIRVLKTKQECTEEYCALMEQYAEIRKKKETEKEPSKKKHYQPKRGRRR